MTNKAFLVDIRLQTRVVVDTEGKDELQVESDAMVLAMQNFLRKLPYEGYENMEVSDDAEMPYGSLDGE